MDMNNPRANPKHADSYQNCLRRSVLQLEHDYYQIEPLQDKWKVRAVIIECEDASDGNPALQILEFKDDPIIKAGRFGLNLRPGSIGNSHYTAQSELIKDLPS
jgi:hypothetical protein